MGLRHLKWKKVWDLGFRALDLRVQGLGFTLELGYFWGLLLLKLQNLNLKDDMGLWLGV